MRYHKQYIIVYSLILIFAFNAQGQEKSGKQRNANNTPKKIESLVDKTSQKAKLDTLSTRLRRLEEKSELIISENKKQYSDTKGNFEKLNNPTFNFNKDFTYPTILSIISAVIFWFAFSYIPERTKKLKIRPKIELDIYNVYTDLSRVFDTVMSWSNTSPSLYQEKIRSNKLSLKDIELGLQNKCLNESYLLDESTKDHFLVIGQKLHKLSLSIEKTVDHIFLFNQYVSVEEIILLEKIVKKLQTYDLTDYKKSAISDLNGISLRPQNPNLSYMRENIYELYQLHKELKDIVYNNKYYDWGVAIDKIQFLFSNQDYRNCLKHINKASDKFPIHKDFLGNYAFLCQYKIAKGNISEEKIISFLLKNKDLVTNRSFLKRVISDERIKPLLDNYYEQEKVNELQNVLLKEEALMNKFERNASIIKEYYTREG